MNHAEAVARLRPSVQRARDFSGWDLGFIGVRLLEPEAALTTPEGIVMTEGRYLLEAKKPG